MMDSTAGTVTWQAGGDGTVLDACYTLAGDKVATCSSTGTVQVWACSSCDDWELLHVEELPAPATQLAWAHPEHGLVLAVGSQQGVVHIIQGSVAYSTGSTQQRQQQRPDEGWCVTGKITCGRGPVSTLAFAPKQYGLLLAAACQERLSPAAAQLPAVAGGAAVMLWEASGVGRDCLEWTQLSKIQLPGDAGSCRCLCWREAASGLPPLLVLGHDKGASICAYQQANMAWQELCQFVAPSGEQQAVVAVDWAPALGRPFELLAASFGSTVALYKVLPAADTADCRLGQLEVSVVSELQHPDKVWRLQFNMLGNTLGCSLDGRPEIWFWMPPLTGGPWTAVSRILGAEQQAVAEGDMLD